MDYFEIYFYCMVVLLGLLVGSFLNVCILRIPIKETIVKGNSHCMNCKIKIKAYDLVPIFSYIFLGGKCRNCKTKISFRYPLIEFTNLTLYILILWQFGFSLKTVYLCAISSVLLVISMIDLDTQEIPNGLIIFLLGLSPVGFFINDMPFWHRIIGFFAASLILFFLAELTEGFGGGDIKLMAACGLLIGFQNVLVGLFIGVVLGGIYGASLLLFTKAGKKTPIPFGPALCLGVYLASIWGERILSWYLSLLNIG